MKLTKAEQELILKKRKEEEESKPKLMGFLKESLYDFPTENGDSELCYYEHNPSNFWLVNEELKEKWIKTFQASFNIVLPAGTKFVCYIQDGEELWFDDINYGIEEMDDKWAKIYLENIQQFKK